MSRKIEDCGVSERRRQRVAATGDFHARASTTYFHNQAQIIEKILRNLFPIATKWAAKQTASRIDGDPVRVIRKGPRRGPGTERSA